MPRHVCVFIKLFHLRLPAVFCHACTQTISWPTPTVSSTPLCWIILGTWPRRGATKTQIFNLWIANNSCMQAVKSPPWIIVFCVCRDVNKPLHPGLTCVLFDFQVDDVFTIAFTCAVCSSLFPTVFLCNWRTGFWQQISLDGINKLEFRCFFCVTPGLLPGVLLCYWSL